MNRKFLSSPIILILPSILAIGFVIIIPLIFSFYTSFTSYKLTRPDSLFNFVGLRNYERLIDNTKFWDMGTPERLSKLEKFFQNS